MVETRSPSSRIADAVKEWPGVQVGKGRRGELAFTFGRTEIGHLHGDTAAHFLFETSRWAELMSARRVVEHPFFPGRTGSAARPIMGDEDVLEVIALLRINYDMLADIGPGPRLQPEEEG